MIYILIAMSELIYHYWKKNPEYVADKFSIVGGFTEGDNLRQHLGKIGSYYGGGEYEIDISELDNIVFDDTNKISIIGANDSLPVSASTVEPALRNLFDSLDVSPPKYKKYIDQDDDYSGGNDEPDQSMHLHLHLIPESTREADQPALRLCDVSDEMLYSCPDMIGADDSSILEDNSEKCMESDYRLAEHINNNVDEPDDNIDIDSQEEVTAMETLMFGGDDDSDIDIMQYLN